MSKERPVSAIRLASSPRREIGGRRERESGQLLVVFALALIAMIGMTGLILDGGDTFVQRREQQNVADTAAMAAGYAGIGGYGVDAAAAAVASANGFVNGTNGTTISVTSGSGLYTVTITKPHRNNFAGAVGFASWNVTTTATVRAGVPNGAYGAMPLIFNTKAFAKLANKNSSVPASFDEPGNGPTDVPQTNASFNWTVFCTANGNPCNGDSNTVKGLIDGNGTDKTVYLNDLIGPLNAGAHTTLFDALSSKVGKSFAVAMVNDAGALQSWAWFHLTGSVGGSTKQISGWFEDQVNAAPLSISNTGGTPAGATGGYTVDLIN